MGRCGDNRSVCEYAPDSSPECVRVCAADSLIVRMCCCSSGCESECAAVSLVEGVCRWCDCRSEEESRCVVDIGVSERDVAKNAWLNGVSGMCDMCDDACIWRSTIGWTGMYMSRYCGGPASEEENAKLVGVWRFSLGKGAKAESRAKSAVDRNTFGARSPGELSGVSKGDAECVVVDGWELCVCVVVV